MDLSSPDARQAQSDIQGIHEQYDTERATVLSPWEPVAGEEVGTCLSNGQRFGISTFHHANGELRQCRQVNGVGSKWRNWTGGVQIRACDSQQPTNHCCSPKMQYTQCQISHWATQSNVRVEGFGTAKQVSSSINGREFWVTSNVKINNLLGA